jgi:hypothetical protein
MSIQLATRGGEQGKQGYLVCPTPLRSLSGLSVADVPFLVKSVSLREELLGRSKPVSTLSAGRNVTIRNGLL